MVCYLPGIEESQQQWMRITMERENQEAWSVSMLHGIGIGGYVDIFYELQRSGKVKKAQDRMNGYGAQEVCCKVPMLLQ